MTIATQRILVVDDEQPATRIIKLGLERTGRYNVREENDPFAALATAREFRPHLILLDVDMPGMDGGEVARQIQGDKQLKDVQVIFLTGLITRTEALDRNSADNFHFLSKPVPPSVLIPVLDWLFRSERPATESTRPQVHPKCLQVS